MCQATCSLQLKHSTRKRIHTPQARTYTPHTYNAHTHRTHTHMGTNIHRTSRQRPVTYTEAHAHAHTRTCTHRTSRQRKQHIHGSAHTHPHERALCAHTIHQDKGNDTLAQVRRYVFECNGSAIATRYHAISCLYAQTLIY